MLDDAHHFDDPALGHVVKSADEIAGRIAELYPDLRDELHVDARRRVDDGRRVD